MKVNIEDIQQYVSRCKTCKEVKKTRPLKVTQVLTDTPGEPFEKVFMDIYGPLNPPSARQHNINKPATTVFIICRLSTLQHC